MSEKLTVYLGAKTALYAPVFMTKVCDLAGLGDDLQLVYVPSRTPKDPLETDLDHAVDRALTERSALVIADPMRLTAFPKDRYNKPVQILGVLVDKPAIYAFNRDYDLPNIDLFIVPRAPMTGYAIPAYFLVKELEEKKDSWKKTEIKRRLLVRNDTDLRKAYLETLPTRPRVAYVSWDPWRMANTKPKPMPFESDKSLAMTAVYGLEIGDPEFISAREKFMAGLRKALVLIHAEPECAAEAFLLDWLSIGEIGGSERGVLCDTAVQGAKPGFGLSLGQLQQTFTYMRDHSLFNARVDLGVDHAVINDTIEIRNKIEPYLEARLTRRSADDVAEMLRKCPANA